jgi:hypothetical protein
MSKAAEYFKDLLAKERPFREAQAKDIRSREIAGSYLTRQVALRPSTREALALHEKALEQHRNYAAHLRYKASYWGDTQTQ